MLLEVEYLVFKRIKKTLQYINTTNKKINIRPDFIKEIGIGRSFICNVFYYIT